MNSIVKDTDGLYRATKLLAEQGDLKIHAVSSYIASWHAGLLMMPMSASPRQLLADMPQRQAHDHSVHHAMVNAKTQNMTDVQINLRA